MKFSEESFKKEFYKLPQLDRIEFRQRQNIVGNNYTFDPMPLLYLWGIFLILSMFAFTNAFLGASYYGDDWFKVFADSSRILFKSSLITFLVLIVLRVYFKFKFNKELNKLVLEYCPKLRSIK